MGYQCGKCLNRGYRYVVRDNELKTQMCSCMEARRSLREIEKSGLGGCLEEYSFETFQTPEPWQEKVLSGAREYVENHEGKWFFIGGNSGSGKTHICTAICGAFLKAGMGVRYMLWASDIRRLKAISNDAGYDERFDEFAQAEVLYIDDLFKVKAGVELSGADVQRTYELINDRYLHPERPTIISTERSVADIIGVDEATGSRIYSRCKGYTFELGCDAAKNWRLYGG